MKKFTFLFSLLLTTAYQQLNAQPCAMCTPVNCAAQKPTGGLCNNLPDDTAGQYYDEVISFYMPKTLTDPATLQQCNNCSYVELRNIEIAGITGLPIGVKVTMSQGGIYDVSGGDTLGCVRFCDIPREDGTFIVVVNL